MAEHILKPGDVQLDPEDDESWIRGWVCKNDGCAAAWPELPPIADRMHGCPEVLAEVTG